MADYGCFGWTPLCDLEKMKQISEQRARELDPELFELLDAINNGTAV